MPTYRVIQYAKRTKALYVSAPSAAALKQFLETLDPSDGLLHSEHVYESEFHYEPTAFSPDIVDVVLPTKKRSAKKCDTTTDT